MTSVAVLAAVAGAYLLSRQRQEASLNPARELIFSDITLAAGIEFRHEAGARGKMFNPETFGPGAGWFDHDGDGLLDLLLVNGNLLGSPLDESIRPVLYRNSGDGRFEDVSSRLGLKRRLGGAGRFGLYAPD